MQEGRVAVGADFETSQFPRLVEAGHWVTVTPQGGIGAVQDSPPGFVDDLVDQTEAALAPGSKIRVLSIAPLVGEAIHRIAEESSVSSLFD